MRHVLLLQEFVEEPGHSVPLLLELIPNFEGNAKPCRDYRVKVHMAVSSSDNTIFDIVKGSEDPYQSLVG